MKLNKGKLSVIVALLVLGVSQSAWATVCDEENFYSDFTSGVNVDRIWWWANLLKVSPIKIENMEFAIPIPDDFCLPVDIALLDALEGLIAGVHTFDFSLDTEADLLNEANYEVTAGPGQVTIGIDLGQEGAAPYLDAVVSFGNVASDCSMYEWWQPVQLLACNTMAGVFNLLIENSSVYFTIDTINVTQDIDTCVTQTPEGVCAAEAEVASTAATITNFYANTEFGNFMDLVRRDSQWFTL